ncbi:MAG: hypothetical protein ACT4P7_05590 [Gemmatimonadaceae bacterium]
MSERTPVRPALPDAPPQEPTLGALLRSIARRSTDAQAAVACAKGTLLAAGIMLFAPQWWRLALAGVAIACFGFWIVLERSENATTWRRAAQTAAIVVGAGSAFALGLSLLTIALGIWKS